MFAEKDETMRDGWLWVIYRNVVFIPKTTMPCSISICNRMGPSKIKDFATRAISTASENTSDINP